MGSREVAQYAALAGGFVGVCLAGVSIYLLAESQINVELTPTEVGEYKTQSLVAILGSVVFFGVSLVVGASVGQKEDTTPRDNVVRPDFRRGRKGS